MSEKIKITVESGTFRTPQGKEYDVLKIKRGIDDRFPLTLGYSKLDLLFSALSDPDLEDQIMKWYDERKQKNQKYTNKTDEDKT